MTILGSKTWGNKSNPPPKENINTNNKSHHAPRPLFLLTIPERICAAGSPLKKEFLPHVAAEESDKRDEKQPSRQSGRKKVRRGELNEKVI